jgi:integrase
LARSARDSRLDNRTARLKLKMSRRPYYVRIGAGKSLGYRRNKAAGSWVLKIADGKGGAATDTFGTADDYEDSDGRTILTFYEAQDKAKLLAQEKNGTSVLRKITVGEAAENYLVYLSGKNPRSAADARGRLQKHFLPTFENIPVADITKTSLERWLSSMVVASDDPEKVRKSKDSANRVLTMVKALLNRAQSDPANGIPDDSAWRHVRPFAGVSKPRDVRYTDAEVDRIIACAPDEATAKLLTAAFLTGTRYGELTSATVADFDPRQMTLRVHSGKSGWRNIILQSSAADFFSRLAKGRDPKSRIFLKEDGLPWKRSEQTRPVKAALSKAEVPPNGNLYAFRHTYISKAIEGGVPLNVIARNCGTSVRMIEKTYAKLLAEREREFIETGAPKLQSA